MVAVAVAFGDMLKQLHPSETFAAAKAASKRSTSVRLSRSAGAAAASGCASRLPRRSLPLWLSGPGLGHVALVTVMVDVEVVTVLYGGIVLVKEPYRQLEGDYRNLHDRCYCGSRRLCSGYMEVRAAEGGRWWTKFLQHAESPSHLCTVGSLVEIGGCSGLGIRSCNTSCG